MCSSVFVMIVACIIYGLVNGGYFVCYQILVVYHSQIIYYCGMQLYLQSYVLILIYFEEVVASGLWMSPGDSEEVATALSQALRNRIERSLLIHHLKSKQ